MESEALERITTDLVEQQVTNETLEPVDGFIGLAQCTLQESITKRIGEQIVNNPVSEGLVSPTTV